MEDYYKSQIYFFQDIVNKIDGDLEELKDFKKITEILKMIHENPKAFI